MVRWTALTLGPTAGEEQLKVLELSNQMLKLPEYPSLYLAAPGTS